MSILCATVRVVRRLLASGAPDLQPGPPDSSRPHAENKELKMGTKPKHKPSSLPILGRGREAILSRPLVTESQKEVRGTLFPLCPYIRAR